MSTATTGPVDIYARRSAKGDKKQRSTAGQVQSCKAVLAERGLPAGKVHVDDGRSAWNPKVSRPGWDDLMARLESGTAGGVIVFDMERFSRRPIEGERLIAAAERGLVVLDSDAEFELTTASGKKSFRDAMAAAAYYSDRLSNRVTRGKKLKALAGEPNGCRPFGFLADGVTPHPEESKILREVAGRLLAGESQESVIADLDARGVRTVRGGRWSRAGLRTALTRPRNAGLVTYRGTVVAKLDGETVLIEDEHAQLVALYAARRPGRPASGAYLCSGAVACAACGKPLAGRPRTGRRYPDGEVRREYLCNPTGGYDGCGKTAIDQRALDEHAKELAIAVLSDAEAAHVFEVAAAQVQAEAEALDAQIGQAEELGRQLADRLGRGEIDLDRYDAVTAPLDKRLTQLRELRAVLGTGSAPAVPVDTEAAWRKRWESASPADRRDMLRLALRGRHLVVTPAGRNRAPVAQRVTLSGSPQHPAAGPAAPAA
jgi:site-specific DNA recombinase